MTLPRGVGWGGGRVDAWEEIDKVSKTLFNVGYNAVRNETLAKRIFSDIKMQYLQNDEHTRRCAYKILQGFQGTHVQKEQVHAKDQPLKFGVSLNLLSALFHRLAP